MNKLKTFILTLLLLLSAYNIFSNQAILDTVANTNDSSHVMTYLIISAIALLVVIVLLLIKIKNNKKH